MRCKLVKETATAKFDESIDVAVNLGVDATKSDQMVRGSVVLPQGIGKTVRVAVFAQGDNVQKAKDAGADIVGFDDLAAEIKAGKMDFDVVIATPDAMRVVGQLGQILGPRGLMPNPKVGTVTPDVRWRSRTPRPVRSSTGPTRRGIVQCTIGRASFAVDALKENLPCAGRCAEQGQAGQDQGYLFEEVWPSPARWVSACASIRRTLRSNSSDNKSPRMCAGRKLWAAGGSIAGGLSKTVGAARFNFRKNAAGSLPVAGG